MAAKIKSGDLVKVIRGKDRGKEGTVKQVLKDDRLIVEGVQIVKKHVRATQQGQQAGIVAVEAPIHRSNVMVIDPETKQPTRVLPNDRLIVEGVQIVKKHVRATQQGQQSGIVSVEAPIHRSNVMLVDPETKEPTRVGVNVKQEARDGKVKTVRVRVAKKSGKELA